MSHIDHIQLVRKLLKVKHEQYDRERFEAAETVYDMDNQTLWKFVKSNRDSSNLHSINHDGNLHSSPDELLGIWSDHFAD